MEPIENPIELITTAARAAHEANRVYCASIGDTSQNAWDASPQWQKESAIKGAQMIWNDPDTTPEQSHEGWLKVKQEEGWTYGEVKDPEAKTHPCFLPYAELPANQRVKDWMFGSVVRAVLGFEQR